MKRFYFTPLKLRVMSIIMISIIIVSILFITFIAFIEHSFSMILIIFLGMFSVLMLFYTSYGRKIYINNSYIKYSFMFRTSLIEWNEVITVGTSYYQARPISSTFQIIYFSKEDINMISMVGEKISDKFIFLALNEEVLAFVQKYWNGKIKNL